MTTCASDADFYRAWLELSARIERDEVFLAALDLCERRSDEWYKKACELRGVDENLAAQLLARSKAADLLASELCELWRSASAPAQKRLER